MLLYHVLEQTAESRQPANIVVEDISSADEATDEKDWVIMAVDLQNHSLGVIPKHSAKSPTLAPESDGAHDPGQQIRKEIETLLADGRLQPEEGCSQLSKSRLALAVEVHPLAGAAV